jgi:hypothetical protein
MHQSDLIESLTQSINRLDEKLKTSNAEMMLKDAEINRLSNELTKTKSMLQKKKQKKIYNIQQQRLSRPSFKNTKKATENLVKELLGSNIAQSDIVNDIIAYITSKQDLRKHLLDSLKQHIEAVPEISSYFEAKIIKEIKYKF